MLLRLYLVLSVALLALSSIVRARDADIPDDFGVDSELPADELFEDEVRAREAESRSATEAVQPPRAAFQCTDKKAFGKEMRTLWSEYTADFETPVVSPSQLQELAPVHCCSTSYVFSRFVTFVMNPDHEALSEAEHEHIRAAVEQFKVREGLIDPSLQLVIGYLSRGSPLDMIFQMCQELADERSKSSHTGEL